MDLDKGYGRSIRELLGMAAYQTCHKQLLHIRDLKEGQKLSGRETGVPRLASFSTVLLEFLFSKFLGQCSR